MSTGPRPRRGRLPLRLRRPAVPWRHQRPTWREARPAVIAGALERALARPSGNWSVLGACSDVRPTRPLSGTVAGVETVVWRDARGRLVGGPGAWPHLGAPLADGPVRCGTLACRWHGLALDGAPFAGWEPLPVHVVGVLVWVRLDAVGAERATLAPLLPARPPLPTALSCGTGSYGAAQAVGSVLVFAGVATGSGALSFARGRRPAARLQRAPERSLEKL
ncbi:hypothetical protein SVIOM342S_03534 [Streptomyces violaceorubidus]